MELLLNDWTCVSVEATLSVFSVAIILFAAFFQNKGGIGSALAIFGLFCAMAVEAYMHFNPDLLGKAFGGILGGYSIFGMFAMACALLSILMLPREFRNRSEFSALMLVCCAGLILFARAQNLLLAFVALECATICLYVLSAWHKDTQTSLEAAVRYLIAGGVSGAILLMGIALLYGASFSCGANLLDFVNLKFGANLPLFWIAIVLIFAGALFKIAAFPFQFWAPDVYQGAPTPVSAFLAVASKGAGLVFLMNISSFLAEFSATSEIGAKLVFGASVIAALTILVGNLSGITQANCKRLLAFSGVSNAGYLLVLIVAILRCGADEMIVATVYFYLVAYMFANYAVFFAVSGFDGAGQPDLTLADFRGFSSRNSVASWSMVTALASLAGIPPTAGFFGKLLIVIIAWCAQLYWLMGVLILGSVISIYYYFAWIRASLEPREKDSRGFFLSELRGGVLVLMALCCVCFGFCAFFLVDL